jgi:predicted translin family RNA/ssDNA-binding protein
MKSYRPSNKVSFLGFQWLIGASLLGGLTIGGITFLLSLFIYFFFIFPVAMGTIGGKVMTHAIHKGKVRNPLLSSLFAGVSGLVIYSSLFWGAYWRFQQRFPQFISPLEQEIFHSSGKSIDEYLQGKTGRTGFLGYVKYSAQKAVVIREAVQGDFAFNETLTWLYWLVELSIIEGIIITLSYSAAKEPFCEACDVWYGQSERVGNVKGRFYRHFLTLIQDENYFKAAELVKANTHLYSPSIEVEFQRCPCCQTSDVVMKLSRVGLNAQGGLTFKPIQVGTITQRQAQQFIEWSHPQALEKLEDSAAVFPHEAAILLAEKRKTVKDSNEFLSHGLQDSQIQEIVEQLVQYRAIKTAYFLQKKVQTLPEKRFYILGVVRRRPWGYESDIADVQIVHQLHGEMELPDSTLIVALNKDKKLENKMQQIPGAIIYQS